MSVVEELTALDRLLGSFARDGREFELLCRWFLQSDPEFAAEYEQVWLWSEWPDRWGPDRGVDLIARTFTGRIDAVQAKNYGHDHSVTKRDIDTFLSESSRAGVGGRLLIASTNRVARSAREVMAEQEKPVSTCLLSRLRASAVDWPKAITELVPALPSPAEPREHQNVALDAIEKWAQTGGTRGQVVMACGTGKSLVEVWAAERLHARRVLLLVPTIQLVRQFARNWTLHAASRRQLLRVCSDKAAPGAEDIVRGDELSTGRTTDPTEIADVLRTSEKSLLVLCTYDSSPVLAKAMESVSEFSFDLAIADEAHRCAGLESSTHKTILDENRIRAARRLFFTATPTIYGTRDKSRATNKNVRLASMNDESLFGPVIHHLSFAEATAQELLCPYQVAVIPIDDDEVHDLIKRRRIVTADGDQNLEAKELATQIACARAMRRFGCRRVVAFHPSIQESKRFSQHFPVAVELLESDQRPQGGIWSRHVDGDKMSHATRAGLLEHFQSNDDSEYRLLSNVKLLTEGVDAPEIDAIVFIDTHRGQGSIIQAVGRAVRVAPGKTVGTIVLPVVLRKGESFDAALARSEHKSVVDLLGALCSHDPDIVKSLDDLRFNVGPDDHRPVSHGRFVVAAPLQVGEEFAAAVDVALTGALGVAAHRPVRFRAPDLERVLENRSPPSDEDLLEIGLDRLARLGRWELLANVPVNDEDSFPLRTCWRELKKRWRDGVLADGDRETISNAVSWLARDLDQCPRQRHEMSLLTDADLPEQLAAQCYREGRYVQELEALSTWQDVDALVQRLEAIQATITHAAMSPGMRLRYMLPAVARLSSTVNAAAEASDLGWWEQRPWKSAAVDGFIHELQLAHKPLAAMDADLPDSPWSAKTYPTAYLIGRREAKSFAPLARRMSVYRFAGDVEAVRGRLDDEAKMVANERLDALGWDIYLLARARKGTHEHALQLAMRDILSLREGVRRDFLDRSLRQLARSADEH